MGMTEIALIFAGILLVGITIALIVVLRGRSGTNTDQLSGRVQALAEQLAHSQTELQTLLNQRLDAVSTRMGKSLEDTATKTAKSIGEIETRLKVIDEAQKNIKDLSGEIVGLQDILSNKQDRGKFGEAQLNAQLQDVFPQSAYKLQARLSNNTNPDCLLKMPKPHGDLVIDSKFPKENYTLILSAETEEKRTSARKAFSNDMKKHINDVGDKYIVPGETADIAIMFLPAESLYGEIYANFPELVSLAQKRRVVMVSPSTLYPLLFTIRSVMRDAQMREQAGVIQKYVGLMAEDVVRLDDRVEALARHFELAEKDIKNIQTSSRQISRKIEKIEDIEGLDEDVVIEGTDAGPKLRSIE